MGWNKAAQEKDMLKLQHTSGHGGGRRLSSLPLVLGGVLLMGCMIAGGYVFWDRSKQTTAREVQQQKPSASANQFANELAGSAPLGGVVPALQATTPELPPVEEPRGDTALNSPLPTVAEPLPPANPWGEHTTRLNEARFTALEASLKSRSAVYSTQGMDRSSASQLADTQTKLVNTRQQHSDPTAAYQERLDALRSQFEGAGNAGLGADTMQSDMMQYARNNWMLPNELEALHKPYTVQAGFVIPAIMVSGISSNLPGQVMAQVSQNVYDSPTGKHLLIPQGTRLVGTYNASIGYGQERVLMAWQRLLFPDGRTLDIQAMPGADAGGKAGFTDQVETHFWRTFSSAFLLSGIVAAVSLSQQDNTSSSDKQRASDALSEALGQNLGTAMAETIRKNLNIAPTLEIRPGYRFNVMVTKDMAFPGAYTK